MKSFTVWILCAVLFCTGTLSAQSKRNTATRAAIPDITVVMHLVPAPSIQVLDKPDGSGPLGKAKKWLQIQVMYRFSSSVIDSKKIYEDMKVELYLRNPVPSGGQAWFTGTQYLHCVIADMEKHYVSLFIPPSTIYRYISQDTRAKSIMKNLEGILIISDRDDNILGMKTFDYAGKVLPSQRATELRKGLKNINQAKYKFVDAIWAKENTPWHWIDADKYDLPRPVFNNNQKPQGKGAQVTEAAEEENGE